MTDTRILVTGGTGTVGSAVVEALLERDEDVVTRVGVRDLQAARERFEGNRETDTANERETESDEPTDSAQSAGPVSDGALEYVRFDFERPETWGHAFEGADRLFLVLPPGVSPDRILDAAAAVRIGADRIVYLSVLGVERNPLVPHWRIERGLRSLDASRTFLRASFFMQNFAEVHRRDIVERNEVFVPAGRGKTSFVDARDVGKVGAVSLTEPGHEDRAYDVTGPMVLDYGAVARVFTEELDRLISYRTPRSSVSPGGCALADGRLASFSLCWESTRPLDWASRDGSATTPPGCSVDRRETSESSSPTIAGNSRPTRRPPTIGEATSGRPRISGRTSTRVARSNARNSDPRSENENRRASPSIGSREESCGRSPRLFIPNARRGRMSGRLRADASLTESQRLVQRSIRAICEEYDHEYWREHSREEEYPHEFVDTLSEEGWMGALLPDAYGGADLGTEEVVVMMEEIAAEGGGFAAAQAVHGGIYNSVPIVKYGSEELKADLLPDVAAGETRIQAFGLTEPNAGSDSTAIETFAERVDPSSDDADSNAGGAGDDGGDRKGGDDGRMSSSMPDAMQGEAGDGYVINGSKIWTSRVDVSDYLLLVARTTPLEDVEKRTRGISMFLVDLDDAREQGAFETSKIPKSASEFVHSYQLFFEDLWLPESALVGEEGEGFYQVLDGLNEERLVIAAECIGLGELALERAITYANDREVFGRPIGKNQAIQHPLAEAYAQVQGAKAVTYEAARADESGQEAGARANTAKYLAAEAAFAAADAAVQAHGGFGVATEYDVERYFREARLSRLVPITQELALNYLGENVLGLPRSY